MALKDYKYNDNKCIVNNHSEFVRLLKWFLKHGAEDYVGNDIPMFENVWDICEELDVKYEDYDYVDDIEDAVKRFSYDLDYFIDGARISCICRIEAGHDDEGVYEGILNDYFDEKYECKED